MIIEFPKSAKSNSKSPLPSEKSKCPACGRDPNPPEACHNKICEETWTHLEQDCPSCKGCWIIRLVDENCNRDTGVKCNAALSSSFDQERKAFKDALELANNAISKLENDLDEHRWVQPPITGPAAHRAQQLGWVLAGLFLIVLVFMCFVVAGSGKTTPKTVDRTEQTR